MEKPVQIAVIIAGVAIAIAIGWMLALRGGAPPAANTGSLAPLPVPAATAAPAASGGAGGESAPQWAPGMERDPSGNSIPHK